jgi:hypothetical protein
MRLEITARSAIVTLCNLSTHCGTCYSITQTSQQSVCHDRLRTFRLPKLEWPTKYVPWSQGYDKTNTRVKATDSRRPSTEPHEQGPAAPRVPFTRVKTSELRQNYIAPPATSIRLPNRLPTYPHSLPFPSYPQHQPPLPPSSRAITTTTPNRISCTRSAST